MEVAGQIGYGFKYRGEVTDANSATKAGVYKVNRNGSNVPSEVASVANYIIVEPIDIGYFQTLRPYDNSKNSVYYRHIYGSTFGVWTRIDNFGCNTLEELAEGIGVNLNHITATTLDSSVNVDNLYTLHNQGMTLLNVIQNTPGLPLSSTGMMIHFQRVGKGIVTDSQQIYQIFFSTKRYVRRGVGNGTTIIYSDWSEW